jgi:predicted GNAT superfamily acetyltransferase
MEYITASKLYDYLECPLRVWRDIYDPKKDVKDIIKIIESVHINNVKNKDNGFLASEDLSEKTYNNMIESYDYCYVCESNNKIIGFLIASSFDLIDKQDELFSFLEKKNIFKNFIYIFQIGVDVENQRKGIGKLLYNQLFKNAKMSDFMVITSKEPLNLASRKLHLKLGFKDEDIFTWSDGVESYVYKLSLK